ncbi:MAG: glycosyltransferase, partial [bacterium]|nr:glycosyltransferase [bacterium]
MGCGCPVIASNGTSLSEIVGDAGILVNPRSVEEVAEAMRRVLDDSDLRAELRRRGSRRIERYTWDDVAHRTLTELETIARPKRRASVSGRKLRVLVQNRADAFLAPGGDTVIMEQLYRHLRNLDVDVQVGVGATDLQGVDIVHLVNATLKTVGREVSENARRQRVPYAVTTLLEDWPRYLDKSFAALTLFRDYIAGAIAPGRFQDRLQAIRELPSSASAGNEDVVRSAALLFACGDSEATRLSVAYPGVDEAVRVVRFGIRQAGTIQPQAVRRLKAMLHLDHFILCCGRLETRKNQLMLLKALEDSEIPIVLASGGFSYQPAYVELIKQFRRKGPVRIIGRLEDAVHSHLMAAAAVHVLPSWYELPGLVTLEAASAGAAVVASDWGAIRDYLPDSLIHYCQPDDPDSIRLAVERALDTGPAAATKATADSFTWERFGAETLTAYESVLSHRMSRVETQVIHSTYHTPEGAMNSPRNERPKYDVSIVIPVYNRWQLTQQCLESICETSDRASYEVIVVDNHSTDETNRVLQAVEGDVTVLRQPENRGFATACNAGARLAQGEFILFLNNDTVVKPGWLDALVNCARAAENIGAVGAKLLYPSGDVQHAGIAISEKRVPYLIFQHFGSDHPAVCETRDMQAVTGACMLVRKTVFAQAGGFDEAYHNGFEDVDLCFRLRQEGRRIVYCPEATVIHREESSAGRKDRDRENFERFMERWSDSLIPDEAELTARHGYTITWGSEGGTYRRIEDNRRAESSEKRSETPQTVTLEDARRRYDAGDLQGAANALQSVVEQRMTLAGQDSFEAWQLLGNCFTRLNKFDEAETAYHKAIESDENSERPYLGLGTLALLQENWQAAMYGYMTALAKNPNAMKAELGVGLSMSARKMHDAALERFERVLAHEPDNAE